MLPRLAASYYSNSAPLVWSFWRGSRQRDVELITDRAPARCAEMLRRRQAEIALTPVIEYQRIDSTVIIPDVCIGAKREVRSVRLLTKGEDLKKAQTVALDVSSKTSVALTEIIFREFFGSQPEFIPHEPNVPEMLKHADAALVIGDPALRVDAREFRAFDVAGIWREFTGCGFVFAFWLARGQAAAEAAKLDFAGARDEGLLKIEEIIDFYSPNLPLSRAEFRRYLQENITYRFDEELQASLQLFYKLAFKRGLIENLKRLQFI